MNSEITNLNKNACFDSMTIKLYHVILQVNVVARPFLIVKHNLFSQAAAKQYLISKVILAENRF